MVNILKFIIKVEYRKTKLVKVIDTDQRCFFSNYLQFKENPKKNYTFSSQAYNTFFKKKK